jgi:hypothetical protein
VNTIDCRHAHQSTAPTRYEADMLVQGGSRQDTPGAQGCKMVSCLSRLVVYSSISTVVTVPHLHSNDAHFLFWMYMYMCMCA